MTLHIHYDHECPDCQALFIPMEPSLACPRCGQASGEGIDFIARAAASAMYNQSRWDSYLPAGWYIGSLGDHVLLLIFKAFESYEKFAEGEEFAPFVERWFRAMEWDDQQYLCEHVIDLTQRVRREIDEHPEEHRRWSQEESDEFVARIRREVREEEERAGGREEDGEHDGPLPSAQP